jgi:amino acid adenylation domain-containing protein/non-ribosomal peptide synthase protein (TIGR01720 family)
MNPIVKTSYALSSGQEAIWFLQQISPESVAYNIFITVKINYYLNISVVELVWKKIIEKHPILKTTYFSYEGKPVQRVNQQQRFDFEVIDASNWSEDHLKEKIFAITDRPFNLEEDSVLRVNLFTCSEKEHILLLTMHHIAGDMWSFDLLLSEFQTLYAEEIEQASLEQTEVAHSLSSNKSYADFVHWQSEMLSGSRGEKQWQYWQQQLAGELPILNLLPDKPRPPVQTYQGASYLLPLDEQLVQKLKHLALASGTSSYGILLAAFYVLLYRYTNQQDILVGSPMRGRGGGKFKDTVGYFVNLIVLRTAVQENATFTELLAQISKTVREAQKHQDYPFSLLAEQLEPQRDISRSPLCQVSFTWQRHRWCEPTENSSPSREQVLQMEPYLLGHQRGADWDLNLMVMEAGGVLQLCWQYNTDLFEATTIERMAGHFVTLLSGIIAAPEKQIWQLPLLAEVEQQQLLLPGNDPQVDYPSDKCIHQLFEEQVARTPDAVAVVFVDEGSEASHRVDKQLTYHQLNCLANQLAHHLQSLGVETSELVGLCVDRSPLMIVGLLGILKAGGAYVPFDPEYPSERLSFMLQDTQVKILLTQEKLLEFLPQHQARVICLDADWQSISLENQDNLNRTVNAENPAYVIYTSGSTGTPKGVVVNHQAVNRLVLNTNYIQLTADDRIAQAANIAFDAATFEIWGALLNGAMLVIIPKSVLLSPRIAVNLQEYEVSILFLTTALFNQIASLVPEAFSSLKYLLFGGESVDTRWVQEVLEKGAPQYLLHVYGPTENTTFSTWYLVENLATTATTIPIGRAIANTQTYILDHNLQLVPVGVVGELYIGGVGLAQGYLNRPELTNERFISNPFDNSSLLYKTGDLARYLPDSNIEYIGRTDNQVKVRGFRIELGEIETVLGQHPQINSVVAIAREDIVGGKGIVAYIVPQGQQTPTIGELRSFLKTKLPEYMIPGAIVILESLPLTPNGKIDRRALPAPDLDSILVEKYVAPRTPIEELLAQIWTQVLKVEQIGIHDNFFELGGHSLLATQVVSRIRNVFQVELPLNRLFVAATVAELATAIEQLQPQKGELSTEPISRRSENAELPLSYAQQRLWFLDQFQPNSALYNIPMALRLVGTLQVSALEQSLIEIIARHEALRTNFITADGQAAQVIRKEGTAETSPRQPLLLTETLRERGSQKSKVKSQGGFRHDGELLIVSVVDLKHLSTNEKEITAQQLVQQQALQPFELATNRLVRATLILLSSTEQILLVCMHHIVSDGWSMDVFVQELAALYNAYAQGEPSPLAPLPIQYADFAIWQRNWLAGDVLQSQLNYWEQQLADAPALLSLPTDRPRPAVLTFVGAHQKFALSLELTDKLTKLSQQQGVTLFMTLLAAYDTLIYRYTGKSDISVGTPIANRNRSEIEGLIGFFVNTLVIRTDVLGDRSFNELLLSIRETCLGAYAHQDLPFEILVEALQPQRDLSYSPLFQVMFVLQNAPISPVQLTGLSVSSLPIERGSAKFDLTLAMENTTSGLVGTWEYSTDLFDSSTIERMTSHFVTLLEGIVADPQKPISQLPLLTEIEQQQLLVEWNNTLFDHPQDKCIHQLFEEQVERTPDAVAVVFEDKQLTYHQLNCRANQLAHYLESLDIKPDTLVGICVERSLEMLVGILGILKAGGAYVPLDPEYPTERLSFMVEDAEVSVLLTQHSLLNRLPFHQDNLVCLDTDWHLISQFNEKNPITRMQASNLAYVIYTSGSTGKPKGVLINHCNVIRLFEHTNCWYNFNTQDVWTLFHSYAFDFSVWEIWGALLYGGTLVVVPYLVTRSPESFYKLLCQEKVTILNQTPSAFRQLIQAEQAITTGSELKLRLVIFGGEALELSSLQPWFDRHGDQLPQLVNMYGITETTVHVTFRPLNKADLNGTASIIGRPIRDLQVYVLDEHLQPVPIGIPGEMYVSGGGVARGYLNRPELTQQRFISNPFNNNPQARLYKTGDLARYLPNGELEYLGRVDHQIKIRGFRIELGEIEALLAQHQALWESVVVVREDELDDQRLVAYVVPKAGQSLTAQQLRSFLANQLPNYMVPQAFVVMESLPLTANGKVDRRALPTPELDSTQLEKYVAPRTPIEEMLAQIWVQVLKVEQVGIYNNFFELGGHSLLVTQLVSRIRNIFKVELPLRELFAKPTVAELAGVLEHLLQQNLELSAPPIFRRAENAELALSYAQQRLWFLDQFEPDSPFYNMPIALRLAGTLAVAALQQSLDEIIARHEALHTNFITIDGKPSQIIQTATNWTLSIVDLKHLPLTEQEIGLQQLEQQQAIQPFDLATQPLVRATLVVQSETEHVLLLCMHHIVSDGWSMGVFVSELAALYNAYSQGQQSPLTPLPIQYADFAIWQRQWLQGDVLQSQLSYWQQQLAVAPALLSLLTDRPRPAVQTYNGTHQEFTLSVELTTKLTKLSVEQGVTLFMTLLAAYDTLLYRYTGTEDILVGTPIANRDRSEIEGLIGFFVNTLVMRTNLADNPSFLQLLGRVREMTMEAYSHQHLPFEMLVEALQPERDLSYTPLFQVMFALQNAPTSGVELTGLTISDLPIKGITSRFDLTLIIQNTATGLAGVWEYNTDLFDASTIERMTGHFVTLLEGIIANPEQQISQLPLLTDTEQRQLLLEWNDTRVAYPLDKRIHQLFEEQVERTPDAVAVEYENKQLTYYELNCRANQLAHYLRSSGVGADALVGLCVERSLEMVIGLLAILKAGAAYVPLDPEYPIGRLSFILEDTQVKVLLTQHSLLDRLPPNQAKLVCLDTDALVISQCSQDNLISNAQANNLAYIIYTSGSTGQPKGIAMTQLAVCNLILWHRDNLKITRGAKTLQFASISFDVSFQEIFTTWCSGGRLFLIGEELRRDASALLGFLQEKAIQRMFLPFVALQQLAEVAVGNEIVNSHLREIITAGEQLQITGDICEWLSKLNDCTLHNHYGPSETHLATSFTLPNSPKTWPLLPAIGRPIANTQIYILDKYLQPVPVGVAGEVYIAGILLAQGYFKQPELTQQKFIPNPFNNSKFKIQNSKLYKTGDLARYLPDGNIEYLGRVDNQVKIRGFRIELGEIEAVLSQLGNVQGSCAIVCEDNRGDKRLVAYIVPKQEQTLKVSEVRRFLKEKLPEYMVPSAIVILDALPLTPNGKLDRRGLPAPDLQSQLSDKYVAPRNPIEEMLALIWAQVLKVELVGIHDNFFELGGHSLLATQLVSRVRTSLKVELPLRSLFAAPTIAELSQTIQQLQQQNLALTAPPILPKSRDAQLPLSFAQTRLWFLDKLNPNSASYNLPIALRLVGTLNPTALQQSLREIIHRHEALRTNFVIVDGQPSQIIQTAANWTLSVVECENLTTSEQETLTQQLAPQPFDLAKQALVRAKLLVQSETEHVLLLCMHHIVSDGWSMGVFVSELAALYNAYSQGQQSPLTPLPIQYADFAIWQRQWLQGDVLQSQLSYWQQQLAVAPALLSLPTDRPRPAEQTFAGANLDFALSFELTAKLTKLSFEQGCTLFMTLLAAYDTLLYRYTDTEDILVGTPIANRDRSEIEGLIGFFVNTLVMRTNLADNPSFLQLLERVREVALSAYAHQHLPFEMLVEALQLERDLSHTPLFQVMFALQNAPMSEVELTGLTVSPVPIKGANSKFDLTLIMQKTATGLIGVWEYNTDLFDASTIERMTGHFVTLLEGIIANPEQQISQLPLLTTVEQHHLGEWNDTQVDYPLDKCIHQLFEEQSLRTPDAVAVVFEDQQLTYEQLNSRANQLAHYLRSMGVGADVLVGICVERSVEMVVGLLGILKAGGAYVPLDPNYPQDRLLFMLEDAEVSVLLTQQHLVEKLAEHTGQVVCLDSHWQLISQFSDDNLLAVVQTNNLAYVIYTSGSTGTPKGVLIAYEGLLNLVNWHQRTFQITSLDKATQLAGTGFDAAVWEIWPYLTVGASIHLVKSELVTSPVNLRDWLISQQITMTFVPTPVAQELLLLEWTTERLALRYMLIGGDKLASYPSVPLPFEVVNNYGPTENTVVTTSGVVSATREQISPSIGRPIANTQVYILDKYLQPVPVGVPGELHIAGVGLARGYLNRSELTQEKFIPNPFNNSKFKIQNSKLYKTGDLARYLPDGNIEYLGRIDNQVKIRGFRIELGEIEAALSQHEYVQTSVVIAREDISQTKRLVAYIVPQPQQTPTISQVRDFLKEKLPDYMVPSFIVILDSLPLTANGKIDRRALPPVESRTGIEGTLVAPRTPVETKLASIWAKVLRVETVGINDNFFELGGDSILSIQIIAKAKLLGIELTLKQLFANQTIAELASVALTTKVLEIEQGLVSGTSPLTPIQQWFFEQKLPQPHHFNQSFLVSVPSDIKLEILEQVWAVLLVHHDALRLRFTQTQSSWQAVHAAPGEPKAISYFDLSTQTSSEQEKTIETTANDLQASLNLESNLVQVALFWLGRDKKARLLIIIHHLVVDGVSWRILLEDLQTGYEQLSLGHTIQLPAKTTAFKDWAQKLTQYANSDILKSELPYWLSASNSNFTSIPVDYVQGVNTVASACAVSVSLNSSDTHSLLQDVPKAYKTQINDVLLTALVLVLSRWTNSKSALFNLEGHGREDIIDGVDLSRTVGWFTTIFPVILKLEAIELDNLGNVLKSVKEQLRAIPNKGIGYGLLHYLSQEPEITAQLATIPIAQISFNYLGQFSQILNTSSLISSASESSGQFQSLEGQRSNLIDINAIINDEQLQINWIYNSNIHQHTTIENLAQEFVSCLQELIVHCLEPENIGYTPTDFPLIKLNQRELDLVLAKLALLGKLGKKSWQNIEDIYPLSPMQEGMLFESLYAPDEGIYFEQITCTFTGNLNVSAFSQAWQQLVARHSIFRTAMEWESLSQPVQVLSRQVDVTIDTVDWRELSNIEQQAQLETFLSEQRREGFQLSQAPLIRLYLLQLDDNIYQFVWCHHHILFDGWSLPLIWKDLFKFYQAISQGQSLELQPTISYRNYIAWLQQQNLDLAKEFWREKLIGFNASTPLTVDKPLSNRQQHSGYSEQQIQLTVSATALVVDFVRQHQLTLNNLVQGTWALLLSRYSGEKDVVFGATVSGRPPSMVGVESMVGLFINTLPVRVQIKENTDLLVLLKDLQNQQVESEQFSYYSLVEIQAVSDVPRGTSLFESIVVFENYPVDSAVVENNGSLTVSNFAGIEQTNYPLTVVSGPGEQLCLKVSYDTSRFEDQTISRMLGHFTTILEAIVANPHQSIEQLPILTQSEQQQLLVEWNDTQLEYPQDQCIHQLFEVQVERTPNAVAVVFKDQQLTYEQLNSRANQLAHHLRSLGVGADVLVGICVERSLDMLVGLLAILKAGGAYVPLDAAHPPERIALMLSDAQISVLVTQEELLAKLPKHQTQVVCLDTDWMTISGQTQVNPFSEATSENLAYVIYTSGSTGKPKGVQICHKSVINFLDSMRLCVGLTEQEIFLAITTISFDMAVLELYFPLIAGGQVVLASRETALDGKQLEKLVDRATIMHATPATWSLLLAAGWQGNPRLKILCGGEALPRKLALELANKGAGAWNLYGPTETTVCLTAYKLEVNRLINQIKETIPIGRLFAHNTQIYILDPDLQPVPVGVPGELHIGGVGVARGYLNRPELTQEKFISNPFNNSKFKIQNSKLYKTGDLARYLPDGNIEYLGRIDNQVKIRGLRIELGEIEAVLSQHGNVEACCVILCEDTLGDKRLVAYVVAHQDCTPIISELRQFLKAKLPEYMIPNAFVMLESLPLTPSGKVDRLALPTPELQSTNSDEYVAPRNPIEEMLAQIWAQVLTVELVGIDDNFFELGGHSLLATQVVSRIRTTFNVELPLRELFAKATVTELARSIQQLQQQKVQLSAPPILPRAENAELPLSYAQTRLWFIDQLNLNSASYNISIALHLQGNLNVAALEQSFIEIIHRHEALRTNFITVDGKASQIIHTATNWTVSVVGLRHLSTDEKEIAAKEIVQQQAIAPFDLYHQVLLRATLVVLDETEQVLIVCMHHIVSDGWSMGVFVEELAALYNAYSEGKASLRDATRSLLPLVPLPIQYADFALWQRNWLQGDVLQSQLSYWQQQLKDAPTFLPLPTDRPRPAVQSFAGAYQGFALSKELTTKLTKLSQQQGVTLFMTLLASFNILLYRYTGQSDILVGTPIANRDRSEIEGLIGFFVNTLVLRTDISGNPSFEELLSRIRSMAMDAYTHQDLPFEMLVEALQPERDLSHTPLFQVMFVLQNAPISHLELAGLEVSSLPIEITTAKFDLTLTMENTATGLIGGWEYNTDLFDASTIERMIGHFVTMLEAIVANPQERISQLPLLTQPEKQQLLVEWNDTRVDYQEDKCIHQLFEDQSLRTPDAVAVVFVDERSEASCRVEQQLTYEQLNSRANQLAHYLRSLGVGADVLVGICVERSVEMVVGLLGILKAGGAYVPLDPEYPQDRLSFMLEDAQLGVLLTQKQLLNKLPKHQARLVCLDEINPQLDKNKQENLTGVVTAAHLANVIYTSGSTGKPKGVMVEHRGFANLSQAQIQTFGVNGKSRILQFASLSFDASISEIIMALGSGAALYLGTKDSLAPGVPLIERLRDYGITHVTLPPSALAVLSAEELSTLQTIIVAGEACASELIKQWAVGRNFFNAYGPTETTVCAAIAKCNPEDEKISIGRPIDNTQIYILDEYLQPVPVGVPGELHIAGVGLARGYLNRSELTVEKFIPNPFNNSKFKIQNSKLYKTGDLARYLPDGNIEYLGRIDNQVKIRGFRIELAEIEAALSQHESVQSSVVIAREDIPQTKRLVAYIVPQPQPTPTVSELRGFLKQKLPDYMVPSFIVILESLPLTANGKVDRRALPVPDLYSERAKKYIAPLTPVEEILAQIWSQVLKVELVGVDDNFFELGGHSLLAAQLVSRIRDRFKVQLPLHELFNTPTIAELAQSIEKLEQQNSNLTIPRILPRRRNEH